MRPTSQVSHIPLPSYRLALLGALLPLGKSLCLVDLVLIKDIPNLK